MRLSFGDCQIGLMIKFTGFVSTYRSNHWTPASFGSELGQAGLAVVLIPGRLGKI